jgi:uncharacterized protein YfaQ (DUF2300 family)
MLFARLSGTAAAPAQPVFLRIDAHGTHAAEDMDMPLGSLWKLFVYAYAVDHALPMPDYVCRGGKGPVAKDELYCCAPGQVVRADAALAQSCGLFFDPERLQIDAQDWRRYWSAKVPSAIWLNELQNLKPDKRVSVSSLLQAIIAIDGDAREHTENALLSVVLNGRGHGALRYLGGRYRVKTFTWAHPQHADRFIGGGAGWMSDGSVVWFAATGSSQQVMQDHALQLAVLAERNSGSASRASGCVDVAMFARYPLKRVVPLSPDAAVRAGVAQDLRGRFRVEFKNGHRLSLQADGELRLLWNERAEPMLSARLGEDEYVARVIDREGRATEKEAARAFGVVVRTYLLQNAVQHGECMAIADSSRSQRVSPNPATPEARDIAAFSSGLVLDGVTAQYRLDAAGRNIFSWNSAVAMAREGMLFDEILQKSFEHASLVSMAGGNECKPFPDAERWLVKQARHWREELHTEPGFVDLQPQVCRLAFGNPYSDTSRQRIYVRGVNNLNQRVTLAHEYLHLAFSGYPSGQDENYVEQWARRLIEGESR